SRPNWLRYWLIWPNMSVSKRFEKVQPGQGKLAPTQSDCPRRGMCRQPNYSRAEKPRRPHLEITGVNTSDSPVDRYRDKKVWTKGLSGHPSGPLTPGDALDAGRADTRRPLRPPPLTAAHHRGVLTPLLAGATAGRERALPRPPSRHGPRGLRPLRACKAGTAR